MSYQVTFTLNSLYTGTTQADNFTIVAKHSNGSPADDILATNVAKADLITGVTYTVADTVTGGTVTSTGTCTNSVTWTGLGGGGNTPTPTPTATPTPTPANLTTFYIAGGVDTTLTGSTYCSAPGYIISTPVQSEATTISGMLNNPIYDANGDPIIGTGTGTVYAIKTTTNGNTFNDGSFNWIEISSLGVVTDVGSQSCSGGGGPV